MGCAACGPNAPERDDPKWVGWLTGTFRRRSVTGKLGDAATIAACPHEKLYIVGRQRALGRRPIKLVDPRGTRPSGCYGCMADIEGRPTGILRVMRALPTDDAYLVLRLCGKCSVEIRGVGKPKVNKTST